jgi:microcystin degradation protein MlrC
MRRLDSHDDGPILLVEPSDNIGGGAPGDGTTLLRALIDRDIRDAVIVINDPEAVRLLANQRIGATVTVGIGGKGSPFDPGPLTLPVDLLFVSDGRFDLEDPRSHLASMVGAQVNMGACAVVRHKRVRILLTTRRTPPFDLGQLRSQGIEPEAAFAIVVKAAVAHRRAYDPIAKASYWVDTPGPCPEDLRSLPYAKIRRPLYPLDDALRF